MNGDAQDKPKARSGGNAVSPIARPSASADQRSVVANFRDISFLIAIYLYVIGFTYYYYFSSLVGVPIDFTDVPIYEFIGYAYVVVTFYWLAIVLALIILAGGWFALRQAAVKNRRVRRLMRRWRFELVLITVVAMFIFIFLMSNNAALHQVREASDTGTWPSYWVPPPGYTTYRHRVSFSLKPDARGIAAYVQTANASGGLTLLATTKDGYLVMVLKPICRAVSLSQYYGSVAFIAKDSTSYYTVSEDYPRHRVCPNSTPWPMK